MPVYSKDLWICATAYIRADSAEDAEARFLELHEATLTAVEGTNGEIEISGLQYDDEDLPDVSLSPAMSVYADNGYYVPGENNPTRTYPPDCVYDEEEDEESEPDGS